MIKRLPERHLSPLLLGLKQDFALKKLYLKFLRIHSRFINPCKCQHKYQHAYCITAQVVRSQKIFCKDCGSYFHLYVKSEKLCSYQLFSVIGKYIFMFLMLLLSAQCILILDSYLKHYHNTDPNKQKFTLKKVDN
jgi:hypothetical protein